LSGFTTLRNHAMSARETAKLSAADLFSDDPLPGVGSESWRALWAAARDYSVQEAYAGAEFPVTEADQGQAACVLCHQPLHAEGADRMRRFQQYMEDKLHQAAKTAESAVAEKVSALPALTLLCADDFTSRVEQIRKRAPALAESLLKFQISAKQRLNDASSRLSGDKFLSSPVLFPLHTKLKEYAKQLEKEKDSLDKADDAQERGKFEAEKAELEDRKTLSTNKSKLIERRDFKKTDALYAKALTEVQTKGITQKANELVDKHLTSAVVSHFDSERDNFDIMHLKISLSRKSSQTRAEFEVDPQTKLTKITSEILSEGEQRALALAGFLTEVSLTEGSGPIIVDDPVSSLDRDRSVQVAKRLAEEATCRQVVVFTHDIVFFNELCGAAESHDIEPVTIALFGDGNAAGKIDPAGMVWKGLNVAKRIGRIKNELSRLPKLATISPADYEYEVKNLYGRLRDTYERAVEEIIFRDIVRRGSDVVQTQLLRYVTLSDKLAIRFYEGMTRANTYSHDNPASDTVQVPKPDEVKADLEALEQLVKDLKAESESAEAARPQMKPKR